MRNYFLKSMVSFGILSLMNVNALLAANHLVTSIADAGPGSLREAMINAADKDIITFDKNLEGNIYLESPLPLIDGDLAIVGNLKVFIDGQDQHQIFFAHKGKIDLSKLILNNGASLGGNGGSSYSGNGGGGLGAGGALFVNSLANVSLTNVTLLNNSAKGGDGGSSNSNYYNVGAGGSGGGGYNRGNGGNGGFSLTDGSGGGGGGGFASSGGSGFTGGGGGGGFNGVINGVTILGNGNGTNGGLNGGAGGDGFGGDNTEGSGGVGGNSPTNGANGSSLAGGGGGGGGGANIPTANGGNGGEAGAIGGGGGGGGGERGGTGGASNDFGGGGGGGGSVGLSFFANGGQGKFGGGGGGGGGVSLSTSQGGQGGLGGFGGGGGGGGKNADPGLGGFGGGNGGGNDGGGGGGAGFGGAIFVRSGGVLSINNCRYKTNSVHGGHGGTLGASHGEDGIAEGEDLYLMKDASLTITAAQNAQLSISGSGSISKNGAGKLTLKEHSSQTLLSALSANSVDHAGFPNVNVNNGNIVLENSITNKVVVDSAAGFAGIGFVGILENSGIVKPEGRVGSTVTPALVVVDSFTQRPAGTLSVDLYPNQDSDQLIVNGKSKIQGKLQVNLTSGSYEKGTKFVVLTSTQGVTGKFDSLKITGHPHADAQIVYHDNFVEVKLKTSVIVL